MIVNQSKFSDISERSRPAVSKGVKKGIITVRPDGKIDTNHPNNADYIRRGKEAAQKKISRAKKNIVESPQKKKLPADTSEKNTPLIESDLGLSRKPWAELEKLNEQVRTLKIKNEERMQKLIDRTLVEKCFGNMASVIVNYFLPMGERFAPLLAGKCGVNDPEVIADMKNMIDTEVTRCLKQFKKQCVIDEKKEI